jgi:hypothetical protein
MLVDTIHDLTVRLPEHWKTVFKRHGLDLAASTSPDETARLLAAPLNIDWSDPSALDLCANTKRAIEPGDPACSLLYHVLMLADCPSTADGIALQDLDLIENYIYSLADLPSDWQSLDIAVLAYQYRPARRTGHQQHADMVFARMGIARNGDVEALYDAGTRSYVPHVEGETNHVRVSPARYGAFLVRRVAGPGTLALIEGKQPGDEQRAFLQPVRKLFAEECLPDVTLRLEFGHWHRGEKLKRAAKARWGIVPTPTGDFDQPPYTVTQRHPNAGGQAQAGDAHITLEPCGDSCLLMPSAQPLIEALNALNYKVDGFLVGRKNWLFAKINRRFTTQRLYASRLTLALAGVAELYEEHFRKYALPSFLDRVMRFPEPRNTPEYINIRHMLHANGTYVNMVEHPIRYAKFLEKTNKGGYRAQMFLDHCAEGVVTVNSADLPGRTVFPAYSVVAAPDFFPYADQSELQRWFDEAKIDPKTQFKNGSPVSLSAERLPANPDSVEPFGNRQAFAASEDTIAVSFSPVPRALADPHRQGPLPRMVSFLSDASSSVFAPGWDVTYAGSFGKGMYLATFGLGSPFAEDIKLCAASNSFWPAVSPDASRTFNRTDAPTAIPMLDDELGFHSEHPLVANGSVHDTRTGWDGEHGPYLTRDGMVDYADINRSDYVANAMSGRILYGAFEHVDAAELIRRIKALRHAVGACDPGGTPAKTELWLVSATAKDDPSDAGVTTYRFLFVLPHDGAEGVQHMPGRLRIRYGEAVCCDASEDGIVGTVRRCAPGPGALRLY